jgi:hypothetical protein
MDYNLKYYKYKKKYFNLPKNNTNNELHKLSHTDSHIINQNTIKTPYYYAKGGGTRIELTDVIINSVIDEIKDKKSYNNLHDFLKINNIGVNSGFQEVLDLLIKLYILNECIIFVKNELQKINKYIGFVQNYNNFSIKFTAYLYKYLNQSEDRGKFSASLNDFNEDLKNRVIPHNNFIQKFVKKFSHGDVLLTPDKLIKDCTKKEQTIDKINEREEDEEEEGGEEEGGEKDEEEEEDKSVHETIDEFLLIDFSPTIYNLSLYIKKKTTPKNTNLFYKLFIAEINSQGFIMNKHMNREVIMKHVKIILYLELFNTIRENHPKINEDIEIMLEMAVSERNKLIDQLDILEKKKIINYCTDIIYFFFKKVADLATFTKNKDKLLRLFKYYKFIEECLILNEKHKINFLLVLEKDKYLLSDIKLLINLTYLSSGVFYTFPQNYTMLSSIISLMVLMDATDVPGLQQIFNFFNSKTFQERFPSNSIIFPYFINFYNNNQIQINFDGTNTKTNVENLMFLIIYNSIKENKNYNNIKKYCYFVKDFYDKNSFDDNLKDYNNQINIDFYKYKYLTKFKTIDEEDKQFYSLCFKDKKINNYLFVILNNIEKNSDNKFLSYHFLILTFFSNNSLMYSFILGLLLFKNFTESDLLKSIPDIATQKIDNLQKFNYFLIIYITLTKIFSDFIAYITNQENWTGATNEMIKKKLTINQDKKLDKIKKNYKYSDKPLRSSVSQIMHIITNYFKCILILFDANTETINGLCPFSDFQDFTPSDIKKLVLARKIQISYIIKKDEDYNTLIPEPLKDGEVDPDSKDNNDVIFIAFFEKIFDNIKWDSL